MSGRFYGWKRAVLLLGLMAWLCGMVVSAEGLSGDDSLSSLGLLVEGASVTPDFVYNTIEYNVTVPAGTSMVDLDPVTSNPAAEIVSITGQELTNGEGTVAITVRAENGSECTYYLYVTSQASEPVQTAQPATEKETQPPTEKETEPETEDPRYVRVERNSLEEAEKTIDTLKSETASYRDRLRLLMRILYGMIAFCVVLLFIVINLVLKKRDLKAELKGYAQHGGDPEAWQTGGYPDGYPPQYEMTGQQGQASYGYDVQGGQYPYGYDTPQAQEERQNGQAFQGQEERPDGQAFRGQEPGYGEQARQVQPALREKEAQSARQDDPATVPKPSKSRKRSRKMPEYREEPQASGYQPGGQESEKNDVEVTMIDL